MLKAILASFILAFSALPANSTTLIGTGTGIVDMMYGSNLIDNGTFFPAGTNLTGKTATITIFIDLDAVPVIYNPQHTIAAIVTGDFDPNSGPPGPDNRPPIIGGGSIDIGGSTRTISGDAGGRFAWNSLCTPPYTHCNDIDTAQGDRAIGEDDLALEADGYLSDAPTGIFDIPTGNTCNRVAYCTGIFEFGSTGTDGSVTLSSLTFSVLGVPEPSTWGMMIIGFLAVGIGLRRRHDTGVHALDRLR